jgi:hypothetical protein
MINMLEGSISYNTFSNSVRGVIVICFQIILSRVSD